MKVSYFTRTSAALSLGSGTIFACLHCIEIRWGCSVNLLLSNVHSLTSGCGLHTFYSRQGAGCSETDGLFSSLQCASAWVLGHPHTAEEIYIPVKVVQLVSYTLSAHGVLIHPWKVDIIKKGPKSLHWTVYFFSMWRRCTWWGLWEPSQTCT